MIPRIRLEPKRSYLSKYRDFLTQEWSEQSAPELVDFLESQLHLRGGGVRFPWDTKRAGKGVLHITDTDLNSLLDLMQRSRLRFLPIPPAKWPTAVASADLSRLALRASVLLLAQMLIDLGGESGLFQDTQSLVFLNCSYFLLPQLSAERLSAEHDLLLNAMAIHATTVWVENPPHQQYLLSALANYLEESEFEERTLRASLLLTPPENHEYLTKAQCLWQFLLDHERPQDAAEFLLSIYRAAPREHLAELHEMIDCTYGEMLAAPGLAAE